MATPQQGQSKAGAAIPGQSSTGLTLEVRRTFASPREKVFAAWAQREQLEKLMCADQAAQ